MSFASDLQKFSGSVQSMFDAVLGEAIIGVTDEMVALTPAQTGNARSNYFWSADSETFATTDPASIARDGSPSMERAKSFAKDAKAGGMSVMSNSVSYIWDLEYGSSMKAPAGMVRTVVARWPQIIGRAAEKRAMK